MPKFTERKPESGGMWLSELLFPVIVLQQQLSLEQAGNEVFPYCEGTEIEGLIVQNGKLSRSMDFPPKNSHQRFSMRPQAQGEMLPHESSPEFLFSQEETKPCSKYPTTFIATNKKPRLKVFT